LIFPRFELNEKGLEIYEPKRAGISFLLNGLEAISKVAKQAFYL